jgi:hypothetical protein
MDDNKSEFSQSPKEDQINELVGKIMEIFEAKECVLVLRRHNHAIIISKGIDEESQKESDVKKKKVEIAFDWEEQHNGGGYWLPEHQYIRDMAKGLVTIVVKKKQDE